MINWPNYINKETNKQAQKTLYLCVNVFSTKVLIRETIFLRLLLKIGRHFKWSPDPLQDLAVWRTKSVSLLSCYFKTLSFFEPGNRFLALPLYSQELYRITNPAAVKQSEGFFLLGSVLKVQRGKPENVFSLPAIIDPKIIVMEMKYLSPNKLLKSYLMKQLHHKT